jgi:uncharacterized protein
MQCTSLGCEKKAVFHLAVIGNRRCFNEKHLCDEHARVELTSFSGTFPPFAGKRAAMERARQFEIGAVIISEINDQQVVYLHEVDGKRLFPLLIGIFEATSLHRRLRGDVSPRPLTHDAWADTIRLFGAHLEAVAVQRLANSVYFTTARIRHQGRLLDLDLRPSDAFILALLFECPIFVAEEVLDQIDAGGNIKRF